MKQVFNSLGSNYSASFVNKARGLVFSSPGDQVFEELEELLSQHFGKGRYKFFYKGRDAITVALELLPKQTQPVFIQAFACVAVEEAVVRAGYMPCYVDIADNSLNISLERLEKAKKIYGRPIAVILQHTFGYPADTKKIRQWCDTHGVYLIEDLAQSFGAKNYDKTAIGSQADIVIGSFGRDKIIDAVSGGFLYVPENSPFVTNLHEKRQYHQVSWWQRKKDMVYPVVTSLIRTTYPSIFSKIIMKFAKLTQLITTPLSAPKEIHSLPAEHATLAQESLKKLDAQRIDRRDKAMIYYQALQSEKSVKLLVSEQEIAVGVNLRFPIAVENPEKLIEKCARNGIHISDRWYREPVDCSTLECDSIYQAGDGPNAELLAGTILNLPTHQYVTDEDIEKIVNLLKKNV